MTRFVFYYGTTLELSGRGEGECNLGEAGWRGVLDREAWELSVTGVECPGLH